MLQGAIAGAAKTKAARALPSAKAARRAAGEEEDEEDEEEEEEEEAAAAVTRKREAAGAVGAVGWTASRAAADGEPGGPREGGICLTIPGDAGFCWDLPVRGLRRKTGSGSAGRPRGAPALPGICGRGGWL